MAQTPTPRTDLPTIEDESRPFWDAARDKGQFLLVNCRSCQSKHHYPRPFCPRCWSDDVEWVPASGRASLYTHSTVYMNDLAPFKDELPYIAAVVELEEGPRVMTRLIDCGQEQLSIGMPLTVAFQKITDEVTIPVFVPA